MIRAEKVVPTVIGTIYMLLAYPGDVAKTPLTGYPSWKLAWQLSHVNYMPGEYTPSMIINDAWSRSRLLSVLFLLRHSYVYPIRCVIS